MEKWKNKLFPFFFFSRKQVLTLCLDCFHLPRRTFESALFPLLVQFPLVDAITFLFLIPACWCLLYHLTSNLCHSVSPNVNDRRRRVCKNRKILLLLLLFGKKTFQNYCFLSRKVCKLLRWIVSLVLHCFNNDAFLLPSDAKFSPASDALLEISIRFPFRLPCLAFSAS